MTPDRPPRKFAVDPEPGSYELACLTCGRPVVMVMGVRRQVGLYDRCEGGRTRPHACPEDSVWRHQLAETSRRLGDPRAARRAALAESTPEAREDTLTRNRGPGGR